MSECGNNCANDLERAIANEGRLARVEEKVDAINGKLDDAILTQLKDHGKRIAAIENARLWSLGWLAGVAAAVGVVSSYLVK